MLRYFIYVQYNGTDYHGWQIQPNAVTIQEVFQKALATFFQKEVDLVAAGRTDSGVHATEMVAHFDFDHPLDAKDVLFHLNHLLPKDISIYDIKEVKPEFHARFDARSRTYNYFLSSQKSPFKQDQYYYFHRPLDISKMNQAAKTLMGEHDFSCFSKSKTQTFTNLCTITEARWREQMEESWVFEISANRFLRNMVRSIVGTLIEVGEGKRSVESMTELIASKDRKNAGVSVPASGLFLTKIDYPSEGFISSAQP
ncbi:MAG: tRNA pseudouridine(38-40) synthase TruA [Verrucomicrobia bacterium]|nr:tRNA pseudouridine(38-40) synthase TruA [Verrucomicrobiota bacterium]